MLLSWTNWYNKQLPHKNDVSWCFHKTLYPHIPLDRLNWFYIEYIVVLHLLQRSGNVASPPFFTNTPTQCKILFSTKTENFVYFLVKLQIFYDPLINKKLSESIILFGYNLLQCIMKFAIHRTDPKYFFLWIAVLNQ